MQCCKNMDVESLQKNCYVHRAQHYVARSLFNRLYKFSFYLSNRSRIHLVRLLCLDDQIFLPPQYAPHMSPARRTITLMNIFLLLYSDFNQSQIISADSAEVPTVTIYRNSSSKNQVFRAVGRTDGQT
jgi:hypothetical protein